MLERYMCSRFFIDFPDIVQQRIKLEAYLRNHFWGVDEEPLQHQYLLHLHETVESSTVCLMGHERRQTLMLIETLAMQVLCREQQKYHHHHHPQQQNYMMSHPAHHQHSQQQYQHLSAPQHYQTQPPPQPAQPAPAAISATTTNVAQPTHIQLQPTSQPGLLYANGVYYAPVIPTTCTCNMGAQYSWLST